MLHAIWFAQDKVSLLENEAKSKAEELAKVLGILPVSQRFSFFFLRCLMFPLLYSSRQYDLFSGSRHVASPLACSACFTLPGQADPCIRLVGFQ